MHDIDPPLGYHWMRSRCRSCSKDGLRHFGPIKNADKNIQKLVVCEYCGAESRKSETIIGIKDMDRPGGSDYWLFFWIGVVLTLGLMYVLDFLVRKTFNVIASFYYGSLDTPYVLVRRWWK